MPTNGQMKKILLDTQDAMRTHDEEKLKLKPFLLAAQNAMRIRDEEELKRQIKERERSIKGESRSKCYHAGTFDAEAWFGGGYLDYRFPNARTIISDIFEGENNV